MMRTDRTDSRPVSLGDCDMLELRLGRLLELHERLTIDKGLFEHAHHQLTTAGTGHIRFENEEFLRLRNTVAELEQIADSMSLTATRVAANRTRRALEAIEPPRPGLALVMQQDSCGAFFRHLLEIVSRIRDDCSGRVYFQIAPENAKLLEMEADHFGTEVRQAFGDTVEDISEGASCLALQRPTACVFHLMRALEVAAAVVADKIGAAVTDEHGRGLSWGVIAANMKAKIDKMPRGSDKQTNWYRAQSLLEVVNRAWRTPTAHPKKTYTPEEARRVFEATKAFMQELAPLA
jgi:hypothetical protein